MSIRWITPNLGTGSALQVRQDVNINIIDVRDLVDKEGNRSDAVRQKIIEGCDSLRAGNKTVICCDYGISRSNAVAVGILAMYESISFETAVRRVLEATGEKDIKIGPLQAVHRALNLEKTYKQKLKRRVLVTGGNGVIGVALFKKLAKKYEVFTPSRSVLDLNCGSTQLNLWVLENDVDCIIHLASPRIYTSNTAMGVTLTMLRNVLDVCVAHNIKLIYLSSWEVYSGYRSSYLLADELLPLLPTGPYGETKFLAEMLIEHFRKTLGLRCTIMRSCPVYGNGDKPKFIYNFIDKIKHSKPIVTHCYKNGAPALDLLYIDDLIAAIVKAVGNNFEGNLNIGTGILTSTTSIAKILLEILGGKSIIDFTNIENETACIAMNSSKAYKILGWKSNISLEKGLKYLVTKS
jgi:nucleoside-diphosphate-sugar epimerase